MTKINKAKTYSIIAAICFAFLGVYRIYQSISQYSQFSKYDTVFNHLFYFIRFAAIMIAFAVVLLIPKKHLGLIAVSGVYTGLLLNGGFYLISLLVIVVYVGLLVLILLGLKNNKIVKSIWFIPAGVLLTAYIIQWNQIGYFKYLSDNWEYILIPLVEVAAIAFVGLWNKEECVNATGELIVVDNTNSA